jgi:hypothetical protein
LRAPALYKDSEWDLPKLALRQAQRLEDYRRLALVPEGNRALRAAAACLAPGQHRDGLCPPLRRRQRRTDGQDRWL